MTQTLSERLIEIDKLEQKTVIDKSRGVVYPTRSGTKDLHAQWQIGGKYKNIKKSSTSTLQIYGGAGSEF